MTTTVIHDHDIGTKSDTRERFFLTIRNFPPIINGRINIIDYTDASTDLISVVERLGKIFDPVKYDMQGNVDKIKEHLTYGENSCLLESMLAETAADRPGADSVLWLNRAILFIEIVFTQLLCHVQTNTTDANMQQLFTVAYEGSVKKYHNWVIQQIFTFMCKASPTMPQFLRALEVEDKLKELEIKLESFLTSLHLVRCKIDEFFKVNKLFRAT